jgi:hypothetical protein
LSLEAMPPHPANPKITIFINQNMKNYINTSVGDMKWGSVRQTNVQIERARARRREIKRERGRDGERRTRQKECANINERTSWWKRTNKQNRWGEGWKKEDDGMDAWEDRTVT